MGRESFAPSQGPEGPEQFDFNGLKTTYLAMKDFLTDNKCPISGRRLLQEFPTTQLDIYTYAEGTEMIPAGRLARLLPEESAERKFAVLVSILSYHMGEVRAWGGVWVQRTCPLNAPPELLSLETRTGPLGNTSYVPQTYTGERREAPWASGEAAHGTDQICPEGPVVGPPLNDHHPGAHLDLQGDLPDLVIDAPAHQALTPWL